MEVEFAVLAACLMTVFDVVLYTRLEVTRDASVASRIRIISYPMSNNTLLCSVVIL